MLPLLFLLGILNVSPYILSNNFESFYNGIIFNSQELVPASILLGFKLHVYHVFATLTNLPSFLLLFSSLFGLVILVKLFEDFDNIFRNKNYIDIIFFSLIFPLLLYFSISLKHF